MEVVYSQILKQGIADGIIDGRSSVERRIGKFGRSLSGGYFFRTTPFDVIEGNESLLDIPKWERLTTSKSVATVHRDIQDIIQIVFDRDNCVPIPEEAYLRLKGYTESTPAHAVCSAQICLNAVYFVVLRIALISASTKRMS